MSIKADLSNDSSIDATLRWNFFRSLLIVSVLQFTLLKDLELVSTISRWFDNSLNISISNGIRGNERTLRSKECACDGKRNSTRTERHPEHPERLERSKKRDWKARGLRFSRALKTKMFHYDEPLAGARFLPEAPNLHKLLEEERSRVTIHLSRSERDVSKYVRRFHDITREKTFYSRISL